MAGAMTLTDRLWQAVRVPVVLSLTVGSTLLAFGSKSTGPCLASEQIADDFTEVEVKEKRTIEIVQQPIDPVLDGMNRIFDQRVFNQTGTDVFDQANKRLKSIATQKLKAIDRQCALNVEQQEKLERAARRDITRFFERVNESKIKFGRDERRKFEKGFRELVIFELDYLRYQLRHGPFGDDSFFAKVRQTMLTKEQISRCEQIQLRAVRSKTIITAENFEQLMFVERIPVRADCFAWDRVGLRLGMLEYGKAVEIYSADGAKLLSTIGDGRNVVGFDFSPDENLIAFADRTGSAFLFHIMNGRAIELKTDAANAAVRFSPDGKLLATTSGDKMVTIWSVDTGARLTDFDVGEINNGMTPEFSPDGKLLVSANRKSDTLVFDVGTGRLLQIIDWKPCNEFRFDPTGKWLAMGFRGGNLLVCNPRTGAKIAVAKTGLEDTMTLDWSNDGSMIVSAGVDGAVTLWNARAFDRLRDIEAPESVVAARFNPAGTRLMFAGGTQSKAIRYIEIWAVPE